MRLLRRNVLLLYSVYLVSLLSGIVVTPIIVRVLGVEQYGIWSVIGSLAAFVILLDLGIGPTVIRFAAEQRGRGAAHETSELASAGLAIYGVLAVATVALGLGLAWVLPSAIDIPERLVWPARATLLLVVGGLAVRFPLGLFGNLLAGQQRYDVVNLGSVLGALLYAVSVGTVLLVWGGGLLVLGVVTFGVTVFRLALPLPWLRRELPGLRLQAALVTRSRLRELARFSLGNFLIQIASKVTFTTDVLVVGILLGTVAAGHYGIAAKLFALVFGIGVAGSNLLFPALAQMEGAAELERQRRYLLAGIRGGLAVVALAVLPLALLPDRLLALWLGGDYQTEGFSRSVAVLVLLVVSLLFIQPSYAVGQFLVARGRHARLAVARLATVSVNLGLSIALAATVGIWGVALATLVTEALFFTVAVPLLVRQSGAIEVSTLMGAWARPVVLAGLAASATLVPARLLGADSFLELGLAGAAWTAAFGALILRFGLEESERRGLANAFLRRRPGLAR